MVGATGFEPATSSSQSWRSSQAELRSDRSVGIYTHLLGKGQEKGCSKEELMRGFLGFIIVHRGNEKGN